MKVMSRRLCSPQEVPLTVYMSMYVEATGRRYKSGSIPGVRTCIFGTCAFAKFVFLVDASTWYVRNVDVRNVSIQSSSRFLKRHVLVMAMLF